MAQQRHCRSIRHCRSLAAAIVASWTLLLHAGCLSSGSLTWTPSASSSTSTSASSPAANSEQRDLPAAKSAKLQLTVAENLEKSGHDLEAVVYFEKARLSDPRLTDVSKRLAVIYDRLGDAKRATDEFQLALKAHPRDANLINSYGYHFYSRGQWKQAEEQFRLALSINPNHQRAWINLGLALGEQDRYEESLEAFTKVVSKAEGLSNLAFVLTTQGKQEDAKRAYREALTIAYGMNRLSDTLVVDIGAGTIDICPVYGTFPTEEEQVTLPVGGDFVDEHFFNKIKTMYPEAQLTRNMAREIKEKYGFVHDVNEKALVMLPVKGKPKQFDVTVPLQEACKTLVTPIVQGLRDLIARFDPEFQQRMLQNIILGGGGSQLRGLDRVIEEGLTEYGGAKVKRVGDAVYAGAVGALKLAMGLPTECWDSLRGERARPELAFSA